MDGPPPPSLFRNSLGVPGLRPKSALPYAGAAMPDEGPKLAELVRQLERFVDHQIRASEELDDKIELLLSVVIALAGGGIGLLQLLRTGGAGFRIGVAVLLGSAILAFGASALMLLHAYVGLTAARAPRIHPGTDPAWLAAIAMDASWSMDHIHHATIKGLRDRTGENDAELARVGRLHRVALYLAIAGLAASAAATFMTLGEA